MLYIYTDGGAANMVKTFIDWEKSVKLLKSNASVTISNHTVALYLSNQTIKNTSKDISSIKYACVKLMVGWSSKNLVKLSVLSNSTVVMGQNMGAFFIDVNQFDSRKSTLIKYIH